MKATLFALFVGLLMVGCGESSNPSDSSTTPEVLEDAIADAVDWSKLRVRDGVTYLPNEETPFTGRAESFYKEGQKSSEGNYNGGKMQGLWTLWYENGQKCEEQNWKDGELDELTTGWYKNGQKQVETNYKDGKLMSVEVWKPNGEKCPVTNVKDGNGVALRYNEDGKERSRLTLKDGERVGG